VLTAFVAEVAGRPVGVVLAGVEPSEASLGHVARMYVAPECWGQGIGRFLHAAAIDQLRLSAMGSDALGARAQSTGSIVVPTPGLDGDW
jgi:GNAT superfamily N-acetyltransferase